MKMVMWKHKLYKEMNTLDYLNYSKANISFSLAKGILVFLKRGKSSPCNERTTDMIIKLWLSRVFEELFFDPKSSWQGHEK